MSLLQEENIREGFLCPICVQDQGSFQKLQAHLEEVHSAEDKEVFKQVKGFFSKAKGKFFGQESTEGEKSSSSQPTTSTSASSSNVSPERAPISRSTWEPQSLGHEKSHFEAFKKMRDDRIDRFVVESNKVLIRLEKLTRNTRESGQQNSKDFERGLVYWVNDEDVPFCPSCGGRFGLARRRHHCRLCGHIMCSKCSNFVSHHFADDLVKALKTSSSTSSQLTRARASSLDTSSNHQQQLLHTRICAECVKILSKRKEKKEQRESRSELLALYEKLQGSMDQVKKMSPDYEKMADSLNRGETDFQLDGAQELRIRLVRNFDAIDGTSKQIGLMGEGMGGRGAKLCSNIRRSAHAYLQDNMLTLRSLPSLPQLEKLQEERRREAERLRRREQERMEEERAEARRLHEIERLRQERDAAADKQRRQQEEESKMKRKVVKGGGWVAGSSTLPPPQQSTNPFENDDDAESCEEDETDPIREQISNVEGMVREAEREGREDEARSLRDNLSLLRTEHKRLSLTRAFARLAPSKNPFEAMIGKSSSSDGGKQRFRNPFATSEKPKNPFLNDGEVEEKEEADDSKNPFLNGDDASRDRGHVFREAERSEGADPMEEQMGYIGRCLEEAVKMGKHDEAAMLRQNLKELQLAHQQHKRHHHS